MTGRREWLWLAAAAGLASAVLLAVPALVDLFTLFELTVFAIQATLALSLGFVWGYGGMMCLGQAAFYGLGGYAYAVAAINFGDSTGAIALALLVPALFALALGYLAFWGRVSDVYFAVITLTVTLILYKLMVSTSGPEYRIGAALLGGYNGIPAVPPINLPGDPAAVLGPQGMFHLSAGALLAVWFGLRLLLRSRFGRVVVAVRENESRAALLGYDTRRYKLAAFALGGAIAGLAGMLYANWGAFVSPEMFSLATTVQIVIWVLVGGRGTLLGPILGSFALYYLKSRLGALELANTDLVLGAVLVGFVLLVPSGAVPAVRALARRALG